MKSCRDYSEKYNVGHSFIKLEKVTKLFSTSKAICDIYQRKRENRTTNYWLRAGIFQKKKKKSIYALE